MGALDEFLDSGRLDETEADPEMHGFFGLHGGVATALLLRRMRSAVPTDRLPVSVTTRFLRPLTGRLALESELIRSGAGTTVVAASATAGGKVALRADAIFATRGGPPSPVVQPPFPVDALACDVAPDFPIPPGFGAVTRYAQMRSAIDTLPFSGAESPVLSAWLRLSDNGLQPDERLVILADFLAPSYTAVLSEMKTVPTVEMTTHFSAEAFTRPFQWALVHAKTTRVDSAGWVTECIDVWSENGTHLATCTQLRTVR